ncbi:TIGR03857 family LLM class F420-dependent oxidoreductase [Nocardia asteroides]|uniref:TIGR03857 family LLM class F420-dependent oxidoreductase n=1 Tax=Nocardia asteroides TaxID=1824 RepID=UPI001E3B9DA1|nr:TIGR03857 family LLM class F420-dependent oxidoreductase [Nocardia asteroides]UGT55094.1 TIGR03857 family LLM class F420-dependent oxidoreductase [Nocardia asteroides]
MTENKAPVVEDLSAWIIAGKVTAETARVGLQDAVDAERLGFKRVFLSERYSVKEAGSVLGGVGALTSRIDYGTGVIAIQSRHPLMTAALGATQHACYGPRFILGIGRSEPGWFASTGQFTYKAIVDHATIVKRLWAGESVTYDGPAGTLEDVRLGDLPDGPPPKIYIGIGGKPLGSKAAANPCFDGVLLYPMITPEATKRAVDNLREACERIGRDPDTLHVVQPVVTAPDLPEDETRALANARMVTYVTWPNGQIMMELNEWDTTVADRIKAHPMFQNMPDREADLSFSREQLMEPAKLIPDHWIDDCSAIGSVEKCVAKLQEYRDAGADEIATYGSSPSQNASLIDAWRMHTAARAGGLM